MGEKFHHWCCLWYSLWRICRIGQASIENCSREVDELCGIKAILIQILEVSNQQAYLDFLLQTVTYFLHRFAKAVYFPYAIGGGAVFFAYQLTFDLLRHHHETHNDRPEFYDHTLALTLIAASYSLYRNPMNLLYVLGPTIFFVCKKFYNLFSAPLLYVLKLRLNMSHKEEVFYHNDVSQDEVDYYRMQDQLYLLAYNMKGRSAFGMNSDSFQGHTN
jgi:hypothetical protein